MKTKKGDIAGAPPDPPKFLNWDLPLVKGRGDLPPSIRSIRTTVPLTVPPLPSEPFVKVALKL